MLTMMKPGADLAVGDVIDFFGELHPIQHFETNAGPLVDAELVPLERFAVDGQWRMRVPAGPVPVVTPEQAREYLRDVFGFDVKVEAQSW